MGCFAPPLTARGGARGTLQRRARSGVRAARRSTRWCEHGSVDAALRTRGARARLAHSRNVRVLPKPAQGGALRPPESFRAATLIPEPGQPLRSLSARRTRSGVSRERDLQRAPHALLRVRAVDAVDVGAEGELSSACPSSDEMWAMGTFASCRSEPNPCRSECGVTFPSFAAFAAGSSARRETAR